MSERLDATLFAAGARFGKAVALEDVKGALTYEELTAAARATAEALRRAGVRADEPVLVPITNAPQDMATFLAVWNASAVAVPISRAAPAAAIEAVRAATAARFKVAGGGAVECLADPPPPQRPLLVGAALIIFTSGSTGAPKGVVLGHAAFTGKLAEIDSVLSFAPQTRALLVLQITFIFGIWFTLLTLLKGGRVFMCPRFDPVSVMADIATRGINDAAFVPTMLRRIVATDAKALPLTRTPLKRIHTGGEPFSATLGDRIRALLPQTAIIDIYGLTETASSNFFMTTAPDEAFTGGIGHVSKSERFRISDAEGREVPAGDAGELQIATPFIMSGYLDQPELTRAAFVGDYFRTGDLARLRGDGIVELVGRAKDLINRAGSKISPLEIDGLIAQHPAVSAALTVGIADDVTGERIHVLVVLRDGRQIDESELRGWVAARVEKYKRPDVYHFGRELPTGRTGKVDRDALRRSIAAWPDGN
jgi:long-chain acyl-CoA synthetase